MEIGIVINADTRPGYLDRNAYCGMATGGGCRSVDFLIDNVLNKVLFFRDYNIEVTLYVDMHTAFTPEILAALNEMVNQGLVHNLVLNRNSGYFMGKAIRQWHDTMYLNAMMLSRAKYIAHFDADTSAWRRDDCAIIKEWIDLIESGKYKIISYPTAHSPNEGDVPGRNALPTGPGGFDYLWASTRFFFCRRDFIDFARIAECFDDNRWIQLHQGRPHRYPNVMEQILGFLAGPGQVCYSPKDTKQFMIFSWHRYTQGKIGALNRLPYDDVYRYVMEDCGGINGACDVCMPEEEVQS